MDTAIELDPKLNAFNGCIGAIDGTHIAAFIPARKQLRWRDIGIRVLHLNSCRESCSDQGTFVHRSKIAGLVPQNQINAPGPLFGVALYSDRNMNDCVQSCVWNALDRKIEGTLGA